MRNKKPLHFTFIANFRGGIYCSQVQANNVEDSLPEWLKNIEKDRDQVKHLGSKIIEELRSEIACGDDPPALLDGLKNVWYVLYLTKKGVFSINIVQTDIQ